MLDVIDVTAGYGSLQVLNGMRLGVEKGRVTALLGGNGCGKSSTLKCVVGMLGVTGGSIRFEDEAIENLRPHQIFARGIAMVPQHRELFPGMTTEENILLGGMTCCPKRERKGRLEGILEHFPRLQDRVRSRAGNLSGGEQQMLATARALMSEPKLLLLDEPTAGLAPVVIDEIAQIAADLKSRGETIFIVEQNVRVALRVADYVYVARQGRVVMQGAVDEFRDDHQLFLEYMGQGKDALKSQHAHRSHR